MIAGMELDDPLLALTRQLERDALEPFGETVNLAPLLTARGRDGRRDRRSGSARAAVRGSPRQRRSPRGGRRRYRLASASSSTARSAPASCCSRPAVPTSRRLLPDRLRSQFQRAGLALTAYPNGVIRTSLPPAPWEDADLDQIRSTLRVCS